MFGLLNNMVLVIWMNLSKKWLYLWYPSRNPFLFHPPSAPDASHTKIFNSSQPMYCKCCTIVPRNHPEKDSTRLSNKSIVITPRACTQRNYKKYNIPAAQWSSPETNFLPAFKIAGMAQSTRPYNGTPHNIKMNSDTLTNCRSELIFDPLTFPLLPLSSKGTADEYAW